jgi:hypothetical protein
MTLGDNRISMDDPMREYMFGVSRQKPSRKAAKTMERIAKKHGAYLVETRLPGTGYQRWFAGPNLGSPFDRQLSHAIHEDLVAAGILLSTGDLAPSAMATR